MEGLKKMEEIWDLYDVNKQRLMKTHVRGKQLEDNCYHLVVHGCIFNSHNQLLIQQRQVNKSGWPNKWDLSAAGSALSGETSQQAIEREIKEELGLTLDFTEKRPLFTVNFPNGFDDYWAIDADVSLDTLCLQKEEVQTITWASEEEVLSLIHDKKFIPYVFIPHLFHHRYLQGAMEIEQS